MKTAPLADPAFGYAPTVAHGSATSDETDETNQHLNNDDTAQVSIFSNLQLVDAETGPPARLSPDEVRFLENGYRILQWDDEYFYIYDEGGNLIPGEAFPDEDLAEQRALRLSHRILGFSFSFAEAI